MVYKSMCIIIIITYSFNLHNLKISPEIFRPLLGLNYINSQRHHFWITKNGAILVDFSLARFAIETRKCRTFGNTKSIANHHFKRSKLFFCCKSILHHIISTQKPVVHILHTVYHLFGIYSSSQSFNFLSRECKWHTNLVFTMIVN